MPGTRIFMFQLTTEEFVNLKSQIVISSWGGIRWAAPHAFTEQGVAREDIGVFEKMFFTLSGSDHVAG